LAPLHFEGNKTLSVNMDWHTCFSVQNAIQYETTKKAHIRVVVNFRVLILLAYVYRRPSRVRRVSVLIPRVSRT